MGEAKRSSGLLYSKANLFPLVGVGQEREGVEGIVKWERVGGTITEREL